MKIKIKRCALCGKQTKDGYNKQSPFSESKYIKFFCRECLIKGWLSTKTIDEQNKYFFKKQAKKIQENGKLKEQKKKKLYIELNENNFRLTLRHHMYGSI